MQTLNWLQMIKKKDSPQEIIDLEDMESTHKLDSLNCIASESDYLPKIKMNELRKDENYLITKIKKINTKYGEKIVLELSDQWQFFVPKRVNDTIINDDEMYEYLNEHVQRMKLFMRYLSSTGGLKFLI